MLKTAFKPIINHHSKVLILGSMPGEQSLIQQQYYANNRNAFWNIMFHLFNSGKALTAYPDKVNLLQNHNIALWDVLASCERKGSLDANIRNGVVNDFGTLFKTYPAIQLVLFNGAASFKAFKPHLKLLGGIPYQIMPSTSPAHTMAYQLKLDAWGTSF
jgi:hypoxanthine-DNA glycosylase